MDAMESLLRWLMVFYSFCKGFFGGDRRCTKYALAMESHVVAIVRWCSDYHAMVL